MNIFCIDKYYTLDKIPDYRSQFIGSKVEWLIQALGLKDSHWPLDSMELLDRIADSGIIPLIYDFIDLPDVVDARTDYSEKYKLYSIQINKSKIKKPLENPIEGRPNFTIWHEIGHIASGHPLIPEYLKTKEERYIEELEADEFAGRFLMPEWLLYSCNYYSITKVAEYLLVSRRALWRRLNNLRCLYILKSKRVNTCTRCGSTNFRASAKYCGICGQSVSSGLSGIRRVSYPDDHIMRRIKGKTVCPKCVHFLEHTQSYNCILCRTHIFNYCMSYFGQSPDKCQDSCLSTHRFCEICGRPTYYYENKFINPWQEVFETPIEG